MRVRTRGSYPHLLPRCRQRCSGAGHKHLSARPTYPISSTRVRRIGLRSLWLLDRRERERRPRGGDDERLARARVGNETRSREINEWINEWTDAPNDGSDPLEASRYLCGCSDSACESMIRLTRVQYEEVRAHGTHFVIAPQPKAPISTCSSLSASGSRSSGSSLGFPASSRWRPILEGRGRHHDEDRPLRPHDPELKPMHIVAVRIC